MKKVLAIKEGTALNIMPGIQGKRAFPIHEFGIQDPFIMLDHIGPKDVGISYKVGGKEGAHPHRGFETLTFMFEGAMNHIDSLGNNEMLRSGDIQRMHAGSGIIHGGAMMADPETGVFNEIQLWVNVDSNDKMTQPEIQNVSHDQLPVKEENNVRYKAFAGDWGFGKSPINTHAKIGALELHATNDAKAKLSGFSLNETSLVYVLQGGVIIDDSLIKAGNIAALDSFEEKLELQLSKGAQVLVLKGKPINQPVALGGPFVMNTEEEIQQAYADFKAGAFGKI